MGEAARDELQRLIAKLPEWRLPLLEKIVRAIIEEEEGPVVLEPFNHDEGKIRPEFLTKLDQAEKEEAIPWADYEGKLGK